MSKKSTLRWESLGDRSPILFLVAGVLLIVYAAFNGIDAFTAMAYESIENVFGPAGFVLGFLGLLGLYPTLCNRDPKLARAGAVCAVLGALAFSVFILANLSEIVGIASSEPPAWAIVFVLLAAIGMVPGYPLFAVASLRAESHSRSVGLCLLVPPAIFGTMVTGSMMGGSPQWVLFLISVGQAMAHLSIGYALWTGRIQPKHRIPSSDPIVS